MNPAIFAAPGDPGTLPALITDGLTGFQADAAVVIPVAIGVSLFIWGAGKLLSKAKGMVR